MREYAGAYVCAFFALLLIALLFMHESAHAYPYKNIFDANDRPLLETTTQVWEARATGYAVFKIGGEHFVVENLPSDYLNYSEVCVRMM